MVLIVCIAASTVITYRSSAMSSEWSFYGNARMKTFWTDEEKHENADEDLSWMLQTNSRIGAKVRSSSVRGRFEYDTAVNIRILWGTWDFGWGSLGVGQYYTPSYTLVGVQVFNDQAMLDMGGFNAGRMPQIRLKNKKLKLSLIKPQATHLEEDNSGEIDVSYPKIEVAYDFNASDFSIGAFGGYQSYRVEKLNEVSEYNVDSYVFGIRFNYNFNFLYINGAIHFGQNTENYGAVTVGSDKARLIDGVVNDTTTFGYATAVGMKLNDMVSFEGGFGSVSHDSEVPTLGKDEANVYYINIRISPAKDIIITPEIGMYDYKDDPFGHSEGTLTYIGAKWMISF